MEKPDLSSLYEGIYNSEIATCTDDFPAIQARDSDYGAIKRIRAVSHVKLYKIRYLMLFLYCICTMLNGFQFIQFSIIGSIISCYYNVSIATINWTSVVFMVTYLPLIFPAVWVMNTKGLRLTLILAAAGNTLSACVQCLSLAPNRFYVVLASQTVSSIAQIFSSSVPPFIAALWFGSEEVSLACAIGVFGNQLGIAFGFLIPPLLVTDDCNDVTGIQRGLSNMALGVTVVNIIVFLVIVFVFQDRPPNPPSLAEEHRPVGKTTCNSMCILLKNVHFDLLLITYGLIASVYFAISTMLNQMVVRTFPGKEVEAGWMGVLTVFAGMIGSVVCGYILDKTHRFRQTSLIVYFLAFLSMVAYTAMMRIKFIWVQFVMFAFIGFFMTGYLPIGYEFAAEITYPEPEATSGTFLIASVNVFGIFVTIFGSWLQQTYSDLASNLFFCGCMLLGCIISAFIKCDKRRRETYKDTKQLVAAA